MRAHILGSGAGGGVPQWNCGCENCTLVRRKDGRVLGRTQDSIAVSRGAGAGDEFLLVNASPDLIRQVEGYEPLWPRRARDTPIAGIVLTNGDLDHVLGLLSLRESQPLHVLATGAVRAGLVEHNAVLRTLARSSDQVAWTQLELGHEVVLDKVGVGVTAWAVPGKLPVHLVGVVEPSAEDNVALRVRDLRTGRSLAIATSVGAFDGIDALVAGADAILFDGTFWSDDELVALGLGRARARDMAHVPVSGLEGSLARLQPIAAKRKIYTHVNNTNPMLRHGSSEHMAVERAGLEVAFDGMYLEL